MRYVGGAGGGRGGVSSELPHVRWCNEDPFASQGGMTFYLYDVVVKHNIP
jgi:hypothetical protein